MFFFNNAVKDAKNIQNTINYKVLKVAWDSYAQITKGNCDKHRMATPAWYALFSVINYKGDFKKFDLDDLHLLKSLQNVHETYDSIISALEDNSNDDELARYILNTNPDLTNVVPNEYDNVHKITGYIASVIRMYEEMLSEFCAKYGNKIQMQIEKLEQQQQKQIEESIFDEEDQE